MPTKIISHAMNVAKAIAARNGSAMASLPRMTNNPPHTIPHFEPCFTNATGSCTVVAIDVPFHSSLIVSPASITVAPRIVADGALMRKRDEVRSRKLPGYGLFVSEGDKRKSCGITAGGVTRGQVARRCRAQPAGELRPRALQPGYFL